MGALQSKSVSSKLHALIGVGRVLSSQTDYPDLFRQVTEVACDCLATEGGTFYLHDKKHNCVSAAVAINRKLGMYHVLDKYDRNDIHGLFTVELGSGEELEKSVVGASLRNKTPIAIRDVDSETVFDLSKVRSFDKKNNYKTKSILVVPLLSKDGEAIGALQLVNPEGDLSDEEDISLIEAMAAILGIAIENNILFLETKRLLDSIVEMISLAIDERSKVTGGHCMRVTLITMMLAKAMAEDNKGPYKDFYLDKDREQELRIAALLHDVGKIATPDIVLEKSKKLESVRDNIHAIELRFRIRALERQNEKLREQIKDLEGVPDIEDLGVYMDEDDLDFVRSLNTGGEFLSDKSRARLLEIAGRSCMESKLIEADDLENLMIQRGTLNSAERKLMENHASISIRLLNKVPWPKNLGNVPEIAGKHHENCDGTGYPLGLTGDEMSLRAKILSLTDRFEGLSAPDRNYREPKTLDLVLKIMASMAENNEIDPELYRFFIDSGVCMEYARKHLNPEQLPEGVTSLVK